MSTYWLEDCKYILTIKVHRANSEFTAKVSDAPAGITRDKQRKKETQRLEKAQSEAAEESEEAVASRVELWSHTLEAAESLAAERILCSKVKRKTAKVKLIEKKMAALEKHKGIFVKKHGEEVYEEKMSALVDNLLASEVNEDEIEGTAESIVG